MIRLVAEDHQFRTSVLQSNKPLVIVDFFAPWCKPCQVMEPHLEAIARRFTSVLDIIKVNTDDSKDLAQASNIQSIPTLLFYHNGQVIKVEKGTKDEQYLIGRSEEHTS